MFSPWTCEFDRMNTVFPGLIKKLFILFKLPIFTQVESAHKIVRTGATVKFG
jgi:hypothetical protein